MLTNSYLSERCLNFMENKTVSTTLHVLIRRRDALLFEEDAASVSTGNEQGTFDILPEHENFISLITTGVTVTLFDKRKKEFELVSGSGMLRVYDNTVSIYLGVSDKISLPNAEKTPSSS